MCKEWMAAGFLAAGFLDLAFWIWTCLIRPSSELLDSLQPEVRALGVICHFSSTNRRPLNADDLKAKQFLATWPRFVLPHQLKLAAFFKAPVLVSSMKFGTWSNHDDVLGNFFREWKGFRTPLLIQKLWCSLSSLGGTVLSVDQVCQ